MKSTIKLISGAAILLASLSGQAIAQETIKVGMSGKYFPFTFVKQDKLQGFEVDLVHSGEEALARIADYSGTTDYCHDHRGNVVRKVQALAGALDAITAQNAANNK